MTRKRIILCLDGTWNDSEFGLTDTNIVRLFRMISRELARSCEENDTAAVSTGGVKRPLSPGDLRMPADIAEPVVYAGKRTLLFYERGVGTGTLLDRLAGGGLGLGLDRSVRSAYRFLARNYEPGDEIFIFGFSRGSYSARSLCGYLQSAGLLRAKRCVPTIEAKAWKYYRLPPNERPPGLWHELSQEIVDRDTLVVSCLGLFDTVGSLGIPLTGFRRRNRERYQFHNVELSSIVKVNLHAVAIDEHRVPFAPSLWRPSGAKKYRSFTEQVWFAGAHADVGGGYVVESDRGSGRYLDDVSLRWMLQRVRNYFPTFPALEHNMPVASAHGEPEQHEPRYPFFPVGIRSIGNLRVETVGRQRLVGRDRQAEPLHEMVHVSAIERLGKRVQVGSRFEVYGPPNLLAALPSIRKCYSSAQPTRADILLVEWDGKPLDPTQNADREAALNLLDLAEKALKRAVGSGDWTWLLTAPRQRLEEPPAQ